MNSICILGTGEHTHKNQWRVLVGDPNTLTFKDFLIDGKSFDTEKSAYIYSRLLRRRLGKKWSDLKIQVILSDFVFEENYLKEFRKIEKLHEAAYIYNEKN